MKKKIKNYFHILSSSFFILLVLLEFSSWAEEEEEAALRRHYQLERKPEGRRVKSGVSDLNYVFPHDSLLLLLIFILSSQNKSKNKSKNKPFLVYKTSVSSASVSYLRSPSGVGLRLAVGGLRRSGTLLGAWLFRAMLSGAGVACRLLLMVVGVMMLMLIRMILIWMLMMVMMMLMMLMMMLLLFLIAPLQAKLPLIC